MNIKKKQIDRFKSLKKVYELTDGRTNKQVDFWEQVGFPLEFNVPYSDEIYYYLIDEGLIKPDGIGSNINITHNGVKEIEEAFQKPSEPTEHFLPVNQYNISIGTMHGGAIQQATTNSTVNYGLTNEALSGIKELVEELKNSLVEISIDPDIKAELNAEVKTLSTQSKSPKPKKEIVKPTLISVKNILEQVIASTVVNNAPNFLNKSIDKVDLLLEMIPK